MTDIPDDELCAACGWRRGTHTTLSRACPVNWRPHGTAVMCDFSPVDRFAASGKSEAKRDETERLLSLYGTR